MLHTGDTLDEPQSGKKSPISAPPRPRLPLGDATAAGAGYLPHALLLPYPRASPRVFDWGGGRSRRSVKVTPTKN